jgi:hypothetical protein
MAHNPCCALARAYVQRIGDLEERLERAEAALHHDGMTPPNSWSLSPQEAVFAKVFAVRAATKASLLAALEAASPSEDGRCRNHVSVVLHRLRTKLADYGWLITYAAGSCGTYQVHPAQKSEFHKALTGEGSDAYPSMVKPRHREAA